MDPAVLINNIALKSTIQHYLPEGSKLASDVKKKPASVLRLEAPDAEVVSTE